MNTQFDEVSRKAAAGTLSEEEREWLANHLREHPERRADFEWDAAFGARLEEKITGLPAMPGWERTERVLQAELAASEAQAPPPVVSAKRAAGRGPGLLDRLSDWFASSLGFVFDAQMVAVALVLVQAGLIGVLAWQYEARDDSAIRAGTADPTPRGPLLRVSFRQDLREAELRRALADIGGEIVGGPGQIGVYLVRVKEGDLRAAAQRLRAGGTTELVEVVETGR
jgi:hypothetical protein